MKTEPVTARKLIKAMHENFRLKGGESFYGVVVARRVETIPSVSEAKKVLQLWRDWSHGKYMSVQNMFSACLSAISVLG